MPDPQIHEPMPAASRINSRGKAWLCNRADALRSHKIKPVFDAVIADWVVEVPQAHAIWHSYHVALMHLRPLRGQPPADLYVPDATHELCVFAMDPGQPRAPAVTGTGFANDRLIAGTFVAQLTSPTDAAATARIETAIDLMLGGDLHPETLGHWVALFGDAMVAPMEKTDA